MDQRLTVRCACGWETNGTEDEVVDATREHGTRLHNMAATREQVLALATPANALAAAPGRAEAAAEDARRTPTMRVPRPSAADLDRFRSIVPDDPRVEVKPMFGNLGAFANGNMFLGLFGADVGVKLAAADAEALLAVEGAGPFGPAERPMGGYVKLPPNLIGTPEGERWVSAALAHVAALPPKVPKPARR